MNNQDLNKYYIDTTKLQVGQVFKNTKSMCEYFGQPYVTNSKHSRESQLKEWKRYIDFEKDGQKIIITDIYPTPLDKEDGRVTNGTQTYQRFIEDILLAYFDSALSYSENNLNNNPNGTIKLQLTLSQIMYICGMVNEKYIDKNIKAILLDMEYSMFNINDFFTRTKSKFRSIVDNALSNMNKRRIIDYNKNLVIINGMNHRIATEDEENIITNIEKQVLRDMECESIVNVFLTYRTDEYHKRIDRYIKSEYDWDGVYRCYTIRVNRLRIDIEKGYLEDTNQKNKLALNEKLTNFFNNQATNKVIKSNKNELSGFKLPPNYKSQQTSLTNYLLSI